MRRREFITTLFGGAAATWPFAARAQQSTNIARIGFLGPGSASSWAVRLEVFRVSLRDLGYVEGQNIVIESRWADEKYNRLRELAAELVDLKVDVIVTYGTPGTLAAMRATKAIPIVMAYSGDALSAGLVTNLARPGGECHWFGLLSFGTYGETARTAQRRHATDQESGCPGQSEQSSIWYDTMIAAKSLNVDLQQFKMGSLTEFEAAFLAMAKERVDAVVIQEDAVFVSNTKAIVGLASKQRLPLAGNDELGFSCDVPPCGCLCEHNSQGWQTGEHSGRTGHQVCACDQP